jgi:hypothetical protein
MKPDGKHHSLSRRQLYERVWSTPATKLAVELGVSDVAIAKLCKKLNIPRPPRGYWAKIEAGQKPTKVPLPRDPEDIAKKGLARKVPSRIRMSANNGGLHPVAAELMQILNDADLDYEKLVRTEGRMLPRVRVSKSQVKRAAEAFHMIVTAMEARGIPFRKSRSKYVPAYFERGRDQLHLQIDEPLVNVARERDHRLPAWQSPIYDKKPSGRLEFTIRPEAYGRGREERKWAESDKTSLAVVLAQVIEGICQWFLDQEKRRKREEEEAERRRNEYEIEQAREKKRKHEEALENTVHVRELDLLKAAEWFRVQRTTDDFIDVCEQRWRAGQHGALTEEQTGWLEWARGITREMSPFGSGYPDPSRDGAFDPESVQFGGPYPAKRDFPQPPTMPKIPPPVVQSGYGATSHYWPYR